MVKIAHVQDGRVVNISVAATLPEGAIAAENAKIGDAYVEGQFVTPVLEVTAARTQRLAELAAYRYEREIAGITVNGASIETDRASQALITGAWAIGQINPAVLIDWKTATGVWVQIDAATIAGIAGAVAAHVQACFSAERVHAEALAALETAEAVAAYDLTTGWPS